MINIIEATNKNNDNNNTKLLKQTENYDQQ